MAKKRKPEPLGLTASVLIDQAGRTTLFTLPVNPGFADPNEVDEERGVEPSAREVRRAERAIASTVLAEYFPADLRAWIGRQARRRGGTKGLTRELMAMRPIPASYQPRSNKHNKPREQLYEANLLRAIERSGPEQKTGRAQAHNTIRDADYGMRIALLALRERVVLLGVIGWWTVSEDRVWRTIRTDRRHPDELAEVYQVLGNGGAGYVAHVEAIAEGLKTPLILDMVHGLKVEVMPRD